ncbi:TonB-dependent receptor [Sphingomonas sp. RB3P16]|uniref:TonB-dependent receptor n=1 Tax=Parasphingomonas frigoris TaxID=3096163 RepID=UPI002FC6B49D
MTSRSIRILLAGTSLLASSAAGAQTQSGAVPPPPSAAQSDSATADIIVTAQNRSESVQNVPIAISVVSGEALRKAGVTDFASAERVSPALQITSDTTNTRVTVRGVGSLNNNEAQDQSIAVNIDGEYINRPTILNASIFDIDRIEVLRGPQGTLYGRNSTGGAVNFITRKPGSVLGANASVSYGNFNQLIAEGGVDVPFGDVGGIRLSGIYSDHDGYNYHANQPVSTPQFPTRYQSRSGSDHTYGGRASVRLKPVAGLTIDAAVEHVEQDFVPAAQAYADLNQAGNAPGAGCAGNGYVQIGQSTPGTQCIPQNTNFLGKINRESYDTPLLGTGRYILRSTAVRGRVAYDLGFATLTYTGGYRDVGNSGYNTLSPAYAFTNFAASVKTQSHELRLNGVLNGIIYQGGLFYFKEDQDTDGGLYSPFIGPNGSYITYFKHPTTSKSKSAFAQVEVPLGEQFTAVGGLRYTDDSRNAIYRNYGFVFNSGAVPLTNAAPTNLALSYSGNKVTWLAGLNYKPNSDTLVYAKVSTGYKAGGFDPVRSFEPESNTAYEGGLKLKFGERSQHIFNVAGFYYDYRNLQNDVLLDAAVGEQTFNAGKATIYGVEADTVIKLSRNDTFTASFNYLHARYNQFAATYSLIDLTTPGNTSLIDAAGKPVLSDLSGNRIPQTPKYVISVDYQHVFDLGSAGSLTAEAYSRFKSDYYLDIFNYRDSRQTAYTSTDLNLEYRPASRRFAIQAYVRNLENIRPLVFAGFTAAGPDRVFNWQFGTPRTYGLRASVNF